MTNLMRQVCLGAWRTPDKRWDDGLWHAVEQEQARCGLKPPLDAHYVETTVALPGILADYLASMCRPCCDALRDDLRPDVLARSAGL